MSKWHILDFLFVFVFGHTMRIVGPQFPNQGLNLGHGSEAQNPKH